MNLNCVVTETVFNVFEEGMWARGYVGHYLSTDCGVLVRVAESAPCYSPQEACTIAYFVDNIP